MQPANVCQVRFEGFLEIMQQGGGRAQAELLVIKAEAGQRADAKMPKQDVTSGIATERPVRSSGHREAGRRLEKKLAQAISVFLRAQAFGWSQADQLICQPIRRDVGGLEGPGR